MNNIVPIVFCFDEKMELAAGVCMTSLLENARSTTFYEIYILHSDKCSFENSKIKELVSVYGNCSITFRSVGTAFNSAFEVRGISIATYYKLLIPEVIPEYDKIIYSDVDVIFRDDLYDIFEKTDLLNNYVAGVVDASFFNHGHRKYIEGLNISFNEYIYAGNLIINSQLIRDEGLVEQIIAEVSKRNYKYQDMDVLNIVCKGRIKRIAPYFCLSVIIAEYAANEREQPLYTSEELAVAQAKGIVHYNGPKPWNQLCINFDIWWEYYRKSIFFDPKYYYEFYYKQMTSDDRMSLYKRVKLLIRYFKNGRLKS